MFSQSHADSSARLHFNTAVLRAKSERCSFRDVSSSVKATLVIYCHDLSISLHKYFTSLHIYPLQQVQNKTSCNFLFRTLKHVEQDDLLELELQEVFMASSEFMSPIMKKIKCVVIYLLLR